MAYSFPKFFLHEEEVTFVPAEAVGCEENLLGDSAGFGITLIGFNPQCHSLLCGRTEVTRPH